MPHNTAVAIICIVISEPMNQWLNKPFRVCVLSSTPSWTRGKHHYVVWWLTVSLYTRMNILVFCLVRRHDQSKVNLTYRLDFDCKYTAINKRGLLFVSKLTFFTREIKRFMWLQLQSSIHVIQCGYDVIRYMSIRVIIMNALISAGYGYDQI